MRDLRSEEQQWRDAVIADFKNHAECIVHLRKALIMILIVGGLLISCLFGLVLGTP